MHPRLVRNDGFLSTPLGPAGSPGAYGLAFAGLRGVDLQSAPDGAQLVTVIRERAAPARAPAHFDADRLDIPLGRSAQAVVDRSALTATLRSLRRFTDAELSHPFLAAPGIAFARWRGAEALHAGAADLASGAVVLLGPKGAGKTTTLAALARAGAPILADDLSVIEAGAVLAGPRALDLRLSAARAAGLYETTRTVRGRRRLSLPPCRDRSPLAAIVVLEWAEELAVAPVPMRARLPLLFAYGHLPGARLPGLDVLAARWLRLARPRSFERLPEAIELLRKAIA